MTTAPLSAAIQAALRELATPFPIAEVRTRPGAINCESGCALVLPYAEWWTSYLPRLDAIIGPGGWQITLQPWGADRVIAHLCAFGGLIQGTASGECAPGDPLGGTSAEAQAKKRVCAELLGLGRFFYRLPSIWGAGDGSGPHFRFHAGEAERCVAELYRRAALLPANLPSTPALERTAPMPASTPASHHAQARVVEDNAERQTGIPPNTAAEAPAGPAATDAQIRKILHDVITHPASNAILDALGQPFGIATLSACTVPADLRTAHMTRRQASALIGALARHALPRQAA